MYIDIYLRSLKWTINAGCDATWQWGCCIIIWYITYY